MKSLQKYLSENIDRRVIDHTIRAQKDDNGNISFYIHPSSIDSDTLDFGVISNLLIPLQQDGKIVSVSEAILQNNDCTTC